MAPSSPTALHSYADDTQIWSHLQTAIANSSGFKRWVREQHPAADDVSVLEPLVRRYLKETLETLAY